MSKHKKKDIEMTFDEFEQFAEEVNNTECCDTCAFCLYIGEGDYLCDELECIVKEDFSPNDNYFCCGGEAYIRN